MLNPIIVVGFEYLPELKRALETLKKKRSNIISGAAIIGTGYRKMGLECEFRIGRLKALVNLLEAYVESEKTIKEIKSMVDHNDTIQSVFGMGV